MKTLYLRNVPDEVADALADLAQQAGMSTSAFAVRELSKASRRARNARIFDSLPDLGIPIEDILADLDADRAEH